MRHSAFWLVPWHKVFAFAIFLIPCVIYAMQKSTLSADWLFALGGFSGCGFTLFLERDGKGGSGDE